MNACRNCAQPERSVINRVHRRDDGKKNLCCANVAGRFVAANVLLARLQGESVSGPAFDIVGNADESAWHVAFVLIARGEVSGVRSAETKRDAKPLGISYCNVRTEFARR